MDRYWTTAAFVICGVLCCLIEVSGQVNGDIVDKVISMGATAKLNCIVPSQYNPQNVYWMTEDDEMLTQNDKVITTDNRVTITALPNYKEWELNIRSLTASDAGVYICSALEDGNIIHEQKVNLIIGEPPRIKHKTADMVVEEGSDVRLYCNASGVPAPTISWYKYNDIGGKQDLGKIGPELIITEITDDQAGRFECVANNSIKPVDFAQIDVVILFSPILTLPYERISQDVGKETLLQCIITANPPGTYSWHRNGKKLEDDSKYKLHTVDITAHQTMLGVGMTLEPEDFGEYSCVAENTVGKANGTMTVYEPYSGGPKVTLAPQNIITSPNSTLLFPCTVENLTPKDWLTWWWVSANNGTVRLFTSQHSSQRPSDGVNTHPHKFSIVGNYDLYVLEATWGDEGTYVCAISGDRNYTAALTVVDSVECSNNGSSITEGDDVHLTCSLRYQGPSPLWDVVWQHGNRKLSSINNDEPGLVSRLVSFPMYPGDEGVYRCEVSAALPVHLDRCSMRVDRIEIEPTSPGAVVGPPKMGGVIVPVLGTLIVLITVLFIVILLFVVTYYKKEIDKYRSSSSSSQDHGNSDGMEKRPLPLLPFFFSRKPFVKTQTTARDETDVAGRECSLSQRPTQRGDPGTDTATRLRGTATTGSLISLASSDTTSTRAGPYVSISEIDYNMAQQQRIQQQQELLQPQQLQVSQHYPQLSQQHPQLSQSQQQQQWLEEQPPLFDHFI